MSWFQKQPVLTFVLIGLGLLALGAVLPEAGNEWFKRVFWALGAVSLIWAAIKQMGK